VAEIYMIFLRKPTKTTMRNMQRAQYINDTPCCWVQFG